MIAYKIIQQILEGDQESRCQNFWTVFWTDMPSDIELQEWWYFTCK